MTPGIPGRVHACQVPLPSSELQTASGSLALSVWKVIPNPGAVVGCEVQVHVLSCLEVQAKPPSRRSRDTIAQLVGTGRQVRELEAAFLIRPHGKIPDPFGMVPEEELRPAQRDYIVRILTEDDAAAQAGGGRLRGRLLQLLRRAGWCHRRRLRQRPNTFEPAARRAGLFGSLWSVLQHPPELADGLVAPLEVRGRYAETVVERHALGRGGESSPEEIGRLRVLASLQGFRRASRGVLCCGTGRCRGYRLAGGERERQREQPAPALLHQSLSSL